MKIRDNTRRSVRQRFHRKLGHLYPPGEIDAFYYLCCEHILAQSKTELLMDMDGLLSESELLSFMAIIERLKATEPIQYILGYTLFCGLKLRVTPDVLIPRPETEELVQLALNYIEDGQKVLDIGTGSACIALAIKSNRPKSKVSAIDVSADALRIAQQNAGNLKLPIAFSQYDILSHKEGCAEIKGGPFDHIISNPPYINPADKERLPDNVRNHEPELALYGKDEDPVSHYKAISDICRTLLKPGGYLFLELNECFVNDTVKIFKNRYYKDIGIKNDFNNKMRFLICRGGQ